MILRGEKTEEYRELKEYWIKRLLINYRELFVLKQTRKISPVSFKTIEFKNGYGKDVPTMVVECQGIRIGETKPEWCDNGEVESFILELGRVLFHKNCN